MCLFALSSALLVVAVAACSLLKRSMAFLSVRLGRRSSFVMLVAPQLGHFPLFTSSSRMPASRIGQALDPKEKKRGCDLLEKAGFVALP
jgi:hypothetical protein